MPPIAPNSLLVWGAAFLAFVLALVVAPHLGGLLGTELDNVTFGMAGRQPATDSFERLLDARALIRAVQAQAAQEEQRSRGHAITAQRWLSAAPGGTSSRASPTGASHTARQGGYARTTGPATGVGTASGRARGTRGSGLVQMPVEPSMDPPELGAATAARVAHAALEQARAAGAEPLAAMAAAIRAAHDAVCALPFDRQSAVDPPATTIVAAWIDGAGATRGRTRWCIAWGRPTLPGQAHARNRGWRGCRRRKAG